MTLQISISVVKQGLCVGGPANAGLGGLNRTTER